MAYLLQALAQGNTGSIEKPYPMQGMNGNDTTEAAEPSEPAPKSLRKSRKRRLPKTLSREEMAALLKAPNLRAPTGLRDRCLLELLYRAGLRVGEVCSLEPRDVAIDGDQGIVRVLDGKGGDGTAYFDPRSVTVDGHTIAGLLERWSDVRRCELKRRLGKVPREGPLFCTLKPSRTVLGGSYEPGRAISTRSVELMIKRRAKRAGLDPAKVTPHVLRHTFATELLNDGFNIREVQEAVRHADVSTTMIYTHVLDPQLARKISERKR